MRVIMRISYWIILFVIFLTGCAPNLKLIKDSVPSELALCVKYGDMMDEQTVTAIKVALEEFMNEFNNESHRFKLVDCSSSDSALYVDISKTNLVGPNKQAMGCLVSSIGLIVVPMAMINSGSSYYIWFAYIPQNNTLGELSLSKNIDATSKPIVRRRFTSFPYFGDLKSQRRKHSGAFKKFLRKIVLEIEKNIEH